jgi:hypothetical protein
VGYFRPIVKGKVNRAMAYFVLKCFTRDHEAVLSNEPDLPPPLDLWNSGKRFTVHVPEPLMFSIDEDDAGEMPPMFDTGASLLMDSQLADALKRAGVDNFDSYQAIVLDKKSGMRYENYRAINIVGAVSAADDEKSAGEDIGVVSDGRRTVWFDKLVIDESKAGGLLMFRLAERISYIMIHESVKRVLEASGFGRLDFMGPEDV